MKSFVPFWIWNKRKSHMTLTPARVASGKAPFSQRVLASLRGIRFGRAAERRMFLLKREERNRRIYAEKFGRTR